MYGTPTSSLRGVMPLGTKRFCSNVKGTIGGEGRVKAQGKIYKVVAVAGDTKPLDGPLITCFAQTGHENPPL